MRFNLKSPCGDCPFRNDVEPYLTVERAIEISDAICNKDKTFSCHKTLNNKEKEHCAGALILLEKEDTPNQLTRIAERLGIYDRSKLNMKAPVYDNAEGFITKVMKSSEGCD